MTPEGRHLARLLGFAPGTTPAADAIRQQLLTDPGPVVRGLVGEALASDDVTSLEGAMGYINDRLQEWSALIPEDLRAPIGVQAKLEVRRRAPAD